MSQKELERHVDTNEISINWFASFTDKSMEADFNDFRWKDVYARYRLLFVVMTSLIALMSLLELFATQDFARILREGPSPVVDYELPLSPRVPLGCRS